MQLLCTVSFFYDSCLLEHPGPSLVSAVEPFDLLALLLDQILYRPRPLVANLEAHGVCRTGRLAEPLEVVGCGRRSPPVSSEANSAAHEGLLTD